MWYVSVWLRIICIIRWNIDWYIVIVTEHNRPVARGICLLFTHCLVSLVVVWITLLESSDSGDYCCFVSFPTWLTKLWFWPMHCSCSLCCTDCGGLTHFIVFTMTCNLIKIDRVCVLCANFFVLTPVDILKMILLLHHWLCEMNWNA